MQQAIIPEVDHRSAIKEILDWESTGMEETDKFKSCFMFKKNEDIETSLFQLEFWMHGVIDSLKYNVNHKMLILVGQQGIGKSWLLRHLLPDELEEYFYEPKNPYTSGLYQNLITNDEILDNYKQIASNVNSDNFKVFNERTENIWCDKRMTSFCGSVNKWTAPQRKEFLVLELKDIKWDVFNSCDMLKVWRELYNKYKIK